MQSSGRISHTRAHSKRYDGDWDPDYYSDNDGSSMRSAKSKRKHHQNKRLSGAGFDKRSFENDWLD